MKLLLCLWLKLRRAERNLKAFHRGFNNTMEGYTCGANTIEDLKGYVAEVQANEEFTYYDLGVEAAIKLIVRTAKA